MVAEPDKASTARDGVEFLRQAQRSVHPTCPAPTGVGVIGTGVISDEYLATLTSSPDLDVRFVAGRDLSRAAAQAQRYAVPAVGSVEQLLADPSVELVVNLTVPKAHAELTAQALRSGRHVWSEKPLATTLPDAKALVDLARTSGLRLGCAPDTFLGTGLQAALARLADGCIGEVKTGFASAQYQGPDSWHPSPEFLFEAGAGPLLDVGPYFLTTLVLIFGSLRRVTAGGRTTRSVRTIAAGPKAGRSFGVEVPTHVTALYEFSAGGLVSAVFSFDSSIERNVVEVAGTAGAMTMPDVWAFEGTGSCYDLAAVPSVVATGATGGVGRGTGVVDMARSLRAGQPHRADDQLALHVLDGLLATEESIRVGRAVELTTTAPVTRLLEPGWSLLG